MESRVIEAFSGINNLADEIKLPDSLTPWAHGGFFSEKQIFERLGGKLPVSTTTSMGALFTLCQLNFPGVDVVCFRHGPRLDVTEDVLDLFPVLPVTSPMEPFL